MNPGKGDKFSYLQRPRLKWLFLVAAFFNALSLMMIIRDFRQMGYREIFSDVAWQSHISNVSLRGALHGLSVIVFLGVWLIDFFAQTKKQASLAEAGLSFGLVLIWGVAGWILPLRHQSFDQVFWGIILVLFFGSGLVCSRRYRAFNRLDASPDKSRGQ